MPIGKKWCYRCQKVKGIEQFYRHTNTASGLQAICKECSRKVGREWKKKNRVRERYYALKHRLREKYGIDLEEYERLLDQQSHKCAICDEPEATTHEGIPRLMAVDHDHTTGQIRGLLCNNCNRGLGLLRDNPGVLRRAIAYLEQPPNQQDQ